MGLLFNSYNIFTNLKKHSLQPAVSWESGFHGVGDRIGEGFYFLIGKMQAYGRFSLSVHWEMTRVCDHFVTQWLSRRRGQGGEGTLLVKVISPTATLPEAAPFRASSPGGDHVPVGQTLRNTI